MSYALREALEYAESQMSFGRPDATVAVSCTALLQLRSDRDQAVSAMREIQRKHVRADKA